ncbi:MAG TPA: DUF4388 domain-containing protein [Acidimicrobiales bacterium]|nr:DUF4388 domain-containing protein [Acidimicrobiales bacterium]
MTVRSIGGLRGGLEAEWPPSPAPPAPPEEATIVDPQTAGPSLDGDLADFPAPEILRLLATSGATGRLTVGTAEPRHVDLRGGLVVGAGGPDRHTGDDDAHEAVVMTVLDLVVLGSAPFRFDAEEHAGDAAGEGAEGVEVAAVLHDVDERLEEWREIATVIPSTSVVARLAPSLPPGAGAVTLAEEEWAVVAALDGRRTLTDVVVATGTGAFDVCALVYRLARLGAVEVEGD